MLVVYGYVRRPGCIIQIPILVFVLQVNCSLFLSGGLQASDYTAKNCEKKRERVVDCLRLVRG